MYKTIITFMILTSLKLEWLSETAGTQTDEHLMVKDFLFMLFMFRGDFCEAVKRKDRDVLIQ